MTNGTTISQVLVGKAAPLGPTLSGIDKRPAAGPVAVGMEGLAGDQQADRLHHGGPEKAVHHYPADHYAAWRRDLGDLPGWRPGGFGENLSTSGLGEAEVHVGDIWRAGGVVLQVSQVRQPCWKLNLRFHIPDMARRLQDTGRTGWYWRVLEAGTLAAGDRLELVERPCPDWPLSKVLHHLYRQPLDRGALAELAALEPLAPGQRELFRRRLDSGAVEDWTRRLGGAGTL